MHYQARRYALRRRVVAGLIVSLCVLLLAATGDGDRTDNARQPCGGHCLTAP